MGKARLQQLVCGKVVLGYGIPCVISALWTKKNTRKLKLLLLSLSKKHGLSPRVSLSDDFMNPYNESHLFPLFCTSNLPFPPQVSLIPLLTKGFSLSKPFCEARWAFGCVPHQPCCGKAGPPPQPPLDRRPTRADHMQAGMVWGFLFPSEHFTVSDHERN